MACSMVSTGALEGDLFYRINGLGDQKLGSFTYLDSVPPTHRLEPMVLRWEIVRLRRSACSGGSKSRTSDQCFYYKTAGE